jgi:hypothetical protein
MDAILSNVFVETFILTIAIALFFVVGLGGLWWALFTMMEKIFGKEETDGNI